MFGWEGGCEKVDELNSESKKSSVVLISELLK